MIIFDIETDGLEIDKITTIHCICTYNTDTEESFLFWNSECNGDQLHDDIQSGMKYLCDKEICGHNIISYDIPVIQKFYPEFKAKKSVDTLILSNLLEPDRWVDGRRQHSLKSYAPFFGFKKVENEEWDAPSEVIYERCKVDVKITFKLYEYLQRKMSGCNWDYTSKLEHKTAEIIQAQVQHGWLFDKSKAEELIKSISKEIEQIDKDVKPFLKTKVKKLSVVNKPFKKNGELTVQAISKFSDFYKNRQEIVGIFTAIEYQEINLSSEKQIKELLLSLGWKPTEWNYKKNKQGKPIKDDHKQLILTSPKLTEDSYDSLPEGLGKQLADRMKRKHRLSQLSGLIELVRSDNRIESRAITCGTNTGRMRHIGVVNIPKAIDTVYLGKEIRSLFTVPNGYKLVGCDAMGLEWRIASHYINVPEVFNLVLSGDIHNVIGKAAGVTDRNQAKSIGYGILYGASGDKVCSLLHGNGDGNRIREKIITSVPGLENLISRVQETFKARGYLKGLDGRKIFIRSAHSALNALIQCAGSTICKTAMCIANKAIKDRKLNAHQVTFMHDEFQWEVIEKDSKMVAKILKQSMIKSGEFLKLRVPLNADYKIGYTWADTH